MYVSRHNAFMYVECIKVTCFTNVRNLNMKYCAFATTYNSKMTNCYFFLSLSAKCLARPKIFNEILQQVLILIAIEVYKYFIYLSAEVPSKVAKYVTNNNLQ